MSQHVKRLLEPSFVWTPAAKTDIQTTWKKHGWHKTTNAERMARRKPKPTAVVRQIRKVA